MNKNMLILLAIILSWLLIIRPNATGNKSAGGDSAESESWRADFESADAIIGDNEKEVSRHVENSVKANDMTISDKITTNMPTYTA